MPNAWIGRKNYIIRQVIAVVFGQSIEFIIVLPVAAKQKMDGVVAASSHAHAVMLLFLFHAHQSSMLFDVNCPEYCLATCNAIASY